MPSAKLMIIAMFGISASLGALAETPDAVPSDLAILQSYADDYETDRFFRDPIHFGVQVGAAWYTVQGSPGAEGAPGSVDVRSGLPEVPTYVFTIESSDVLRKLDAGNVSALTLAGKAQSADYAPLDIDLMDGAELPDWFGDKITRLLFHFWTRGWPETVPYATQETRLVHSTDLAALYYQPGFRSAYFDMQPGRHANEGEGEASADPYTSMFILLEGELKVILDGEEFPLTEGNMIIVPPNVRHEIINESDAQARGLLMMFGEGA